ncbi:hypothetical protein FRC00_011118 [Tulasnella sp. 408]|nr:hypothetical protein FRC00_011118 [Tulasnella sp. 408]
MFAKFRSTRTPATTPVPTPQFEAGPPSQSAPKTSPSLVKKFLRVKHVFRRSSSARKNAHHQGTPSRREGVLTPSQPSQGPTAVIDDDRAAFDRRPYLHPSVEPTRSPSSLNLSLRFQAGWQSSTSSAHRSNLLATASPQLAPPRSVAAAPATSHSAALRLKTSPNAASPLAPPASVATTVWNDSVTVKRQDAPRQITPSRRQGVPTLSRPSQVPSALRDLSPPFQTRWQSSTSSAAHRLNLSSTATPLVAPSQRVAAAPATSFTPTRSSSNRSTQSAAPRLTTSLNASPLLAPPASIATTPATSSAPARSPFQSSTRSTTSPSTSSPLAPPRAVATAPATTFSSAHYPSRRSASSTAPHSTSSLNASPLVAPPQSVATTPATEPSSVLSSFNCSRPSNNSSTHQLIAGLEETVAHLHRQYHDARRSAHTMIQWHVFPYAMSLADEAKKAKEELDKVMKQIAAVDSDCSQLEALLRDEHEKLEETEEALKKAYWHREGVNEEHALLQADNHELQAGQPVDGVWQQRPSEPLQRDSTPSQPVANQERGSSLATLESSQRVKSWDSRWQSMIERQRYSLPRPVHSESNEPEGRTNTARPADTSDYFGRPLRWGQLAPICSVHPKKENTRPGKNP